MISEDLRRKNASLRDRIEEVLEMHPELRDGIEAIALSQDLHVEVGAAFLERTRDALSWSIISTSDVAEGSPTRLASYGLRRPRRTMAATLGNRKA